MEVLLGVQKKSRVFRDFKNYFVKFTTRTNITPTLIIPNLLSYKGNMIVENIKGEVSLLTSKYRQEILEQNIYEVNPGDSLEDLAFKAPFTIYVTIQPGESNELIRNTFNELVQKLDNKNTFLVTREDFLGNARLKEGQNMIFIIEDKLPEGKNALFIDWTEEKPRLEEEEIEKILFYKDKEMMKKVNRE
jgi:hypothetical protein